MSILQSLKASWASYRQGQAEQIQTLKASGNKASVWRFFSLNLHLFLNMEGIRAAAREEALAVGSRYDVPNDPSVPDDLRDTKGRFFRTREGYRITGRLLVQDILEGSPSPGAPILLGLFPVVLFIAGLLGHLGSTGGLAAVVLNLVYLVVVQRVFGLASTLLIAILMTASTVLSLLTSLPLAGGMFAAVINLIPLWMKALVLGLLPALLPWLYVRRQANERAKVLAVQGSLANLESTGKLSRAHEGARRLQAKAAAEDSSPFIPYGIARGIFTNKHDGYAPDAGLPVGQSLNDLSTHKITFGATGSGKSSRQATPDGINYALAQHGGMLVLDGKGTGPADMAQAMVKLNLPFTLIDPKNNPEIRIALLQGLSPEDAVLAVLSAFVHQGKKGGSADEGFYENSGATLLLHAAESLIAAITIEKTQIAQDLAAGVEPQPRTWHWTLKDWYRQVQDMQRPAFQQQFVLWVRQNAPEAAQEGLLNDALLYISEEMPQMDERTRSNIISTVNAWLSPVMAHRVLKPWASIEEGFDVRTVCTGAMVGVRLPEFEFGKAGLLANALIKARVFTEIRRRPTDWAKDRTQKPVMMHVDECQDIVGPSDLAILPVARSQGLICNYLTQHIDGLFVKLGAMEAKAFLGNFLSFVCYRSTPATAEWVSERLGTTENLVFGASGLGLDYDFTSKMALSSPFHDPAHPLRKQLQASRRKGQGGTLQSLMRKVYTKKNDDNINAIMFKNATEVSPVTNGEHKLEPLMSEAEWDAYTNIPFVAIAQVMRGGVRRRDVIQTLTIEQWGQHKDHPSETPFDLGT